MTERTTSTRGPIGLISTDAEALAWFKAFHGPNAEMHELKCHPEPFAAVRDGRKRYELRINDRGYMVGDVLHLREHDNQVYTGAEIVCVVTYMTPASTYGLPDDLCCMSIGAIAEAEWPLPRRGLTPDREASHARLGLDAPLGYPPGWPACPGCGLPALDGKITCGNAACGSSTGQDGGRHG